MRPYWAAMAEAKATMLGMELVPPSQFTERYYTVRGREFHQVFQGLPQLSKFYMDWEKNYNAERIYWLIVDNPWIPWFSLGVYLLFIFGYPSVAKRYGVGYISARFQMASWNLFLAAFSWIGAIRVVPHFFFLVKTIGLDQVLCGAPEPLYGDGAVGFWIQAFVLSKVAELLDTVFVVLRQKDPIFLHWYHHVTVLLFTWFTYSYENPGIIFIAMNYSVHAVMYTYYWLAIIKKVPDWFPTWLITLAQILQMVVGVFVAFNYYRVLSSGGSCAVSTDLLWACAVMYSTYLYLFVEFAVKRYIIKPITDARNKSLKIKKN